MDINFEDQVRKAFPGEKIRFMTMSRREGWASCAGCPGFHIDRASDGYPYRGFYRPSDGIWGIQDFRFGGTGYSLQEAISTLDSQRFHPAEVLLRKVIEKFVSDKGPRKEELLKEVETLEAQLGKRLDYIRYKMWNYGWIASR